MPLYDWSLYSGKKSDKDKNRLITEPVGVISDNAGSGALWLPTTSSGSAGDQYRGILATEKDSIWDKDAAAIPLGEVGNGANAFLTPIAAVPESVTGAGAAAANFTPAYVQGARTTDNYAQSQNPGGNGGGTAGNRGNGGGGSGGNGTNDRYAGYRATLDDLYNKVMGYGSYTAGTYTPGRYSKQYDTSGLEGQLAGWLNEIDNYGEFKYDLNADLLYKQMADNYIQQGQLAMQDTTANAAALTGGYGNSYAASVGNQAFQQHLTALNNNIPALQQQALNVWQAGLDQLYGQMDAGSQQLNNLLALEAQALAQWQANENASFSAWQANESNRYNEWLAGYNQLMDQYNLGSTHIGNLETYQPKSYSSSSSKKTTTTPAASGAAAVLAGIAAAQATANKNATNANKSDSGDKGSAWDDLYYILTGKKK